ncbi:MAG: S49 family peptidase, partial [Bacteroidales bacterium]|nr:S49 family peptidase [Bacteroidales bacterium]
MYQFSIDEEIAPPASLRVEKAMEEAREIKADIIVVHINTFGGTLDDADKIRTAFLQSEIPVYAYIDNNAASAGALISIACDSIYMHSGSSIGAATVVDMSGEVQPDKYQSYMRSLMRTTAETRGRRPDIAEAMVDPDIYVAGISDSGKVLTFTTSEAVKYGYCEAEVENVKSLLDHAGIKEYTIHEQRYSFIDKLIGFLVTPVVSGILIMLIIGGIYFELQQPGIGFPLILALSAAALYFAPLYLDGLATYWEIIIFIVGLVLIAIEIFVIPGFGVAGVLGIICVVVGLAFSMVGNIGFDFSGLPSGTFANRLMIVLVAMAISLPLSILLGKKLFEST